MAAELVAHGADVNVTDEDAISPLMSASENGLTEVVRFLLSSGADPAAVDRHGMTAIDWVYQWSLKPPEDATLLLLDAGAVPGNREAVLEEARRHGHGRVVAWLEEHRADHAVNALATSLTEALARGFGHDRCTR